MTIDEAYRLIKYVVNKDQSGSILPGDFNLLAKSAQMSLIRDKYGNELKGQAGMPPYGLGTSQKIIDNLSVLLKSKTISISSGIGNKPTDYLHIESATLTDDTTVEFMDNDKFRHRRKSEVVAPTTEYPIGCFVGDEIHILPDTVDSLKLYYLRLPADPKWVGDINNNYLVASSVDFELPADTHIEICRLILQDVGINLELPTLVQYSASKEMIGT